MVFSNELALCSRHQRYFSTRPNILRLAERSRTKILLAGTLVDSPTALASGIESRHYTDIKNIKTDVTEVRDHVRSEAHQRILEWLSTVDYSSVQNDRIAQRRPGTGQWLLESDEFKN